MAEPEVVIEDPTPTGDEEMAEATGLEGTDTMAEDNEPTGLEDIEPDVPERTTFLEYASHDFI